MRVHVLYSSGGNPNPGPLGSPMAHLGFIGKLHTTGLLHDGQPVAMRCTAMGAFGPTVRRNTGGASGFPTASHGRSDVCLGERFLQRTSE